MQMRHGLGMRQPVNGRGNDNGMATPSAYLGLAAIDFHFDVHTPPPLHTDNHDAVEME